MNLTKKLITFKINIIILYNNFVINLKSVLAVFKNKFLIYKNWFILFIIKDYFNFYSIIII